MTLPERMPHDATAVDRALREGSPVLDEAGATFVWFGDEPPPTIVGDWCDRRGTNLPGTDDEPPARWSDPWDNSRALQLSPLSTRDGAWAVRVGLPSDAYVEYALQRNGRRVVDPLNPHRSRGGLDTANMRFWMPDAARRAQYLARHSRAQRGTLTRHVVNFHWLSASPHKRRIDLYLPARGDARTLPLLVVLDGNGYREGGHLVPVLDALIATEQMAPVAAAFVSNAGSSRSIEYAGNDFTLSALSRIVVPMAIDRLGLGDLSGLDGVGKVAILGSSMGGLMALYAGLRMPQLFGSVIAQSGAYSFRETEMITGPLVRHLPVAPIGIWLDVGQSESLAPANHEMYGLLAGQGYDVEFRRHPGGHNQTAWVESLVDALPWTFPPPG